MIFDRGRHKIFCVDLLPVETDAYNLEMVEVNQEEYLFPRMDYSGNTHSTLPESSFHIRVNSKNDSLT